METLVEGSDWRTWIEQFEHEGGWGSGTSAPTQSKPSPAESWDQTDRPLSFWKNQPEPAAAAARQRPAPNVGDVNSARARWRQEHDVQTQFLDAGIGCCWFASQGDEEPVCGETEEAALERLAHDNGLPWPMSAA